MKIGKIAMAWCVLILVAIPAIFFFSGKPSIEAYRNDPNLRIAADVSFDKPAPIGTKVTQITDLSKLDFGEVTNDQSTLENTNMTVTEIERGASAYATLQKADPTIAPAPDGYEYLLAKVSASMQAALSSTTWLGAIQLHWDLKNEDFHCYSSDQTEYAAAYVPNPPDPNMKFTIILISGQSADTWAFFQVATTDLQPRMYYGIDQITYWFALYK
jgi:hypothetical protein